MGRAVYNLMVSLSKSFEMFKRSSDVEYLKLFSRREYETSFEDSKELELYTNVTVLLCWIQHSIPGAEECEL